MGLARHPFNLSTTFRSFLTWVVKIQELKLARFSEIPMGNGLLASTPGRVLP